MGGNVITGENPNPSSSNPKLCSNVGDWMVGTKEGKEIEYFLVDGSTPCNSIVSRFLSTSGTNSSKLDSIVFFGDSTMGMLVGQFSKPMKRMNKSWPTRCSTVEILGFSRAPDWLPPSSSSKLWPVGPAANGLQNPWCHDCSGCDYLSFESESPTNNSSTLMGSLQLTSAEYIPMEFALDVTLQTTAGRTTQETIYAYLEKTYR